MPAEPKTYQDKWSAVPGGMQSSFAPELLNKNQFSFGQNNSIRKGFIHPRPAFQNRTLNFNGNGALQNLVQNGYYQGGGYYRPDAGAESLVAQISGHLILFTPTGNTFLVTDISIPGDLNNATAPQVWMWQAENYLIVQDGTGALPIFYDGTTSRRSFGASQLLGTTSADFTPPAIGASVTLTLTEPYTGPYNIPVILDGEFYQPVQNANGYPVILTNLTAATGETIPAGSQLVIQPSTLADVTQVISATLGTGLLKAFVALSSKVPGLNSPTDSMLVNVAGAMYQPYFNGQPSGAPVPVQQPMKLQLTTDLTTYVVQLTYSATGILVIPQNALVTTQNSAPNVPIGNTVNDFIVPAVNGHVNIALTAPFTGANGQVVYIGTEAFSIANPPTPPASTSLIVINLTDTKTTTVAHPATIMSVPELPAGRCGAYGMGCNAVSLTDGISYIIGDVVGSASGTPALKYRDAVLKITSNTFLAGGGTFRLPGTGDIITAMVFPTIQDAALGQGPLAIGTRKSIFTNVVPGTNPTTWVTLTTPIQTEALKDKGPMGQWNTILVNSDVFFRSFDGISTLVNARREFYDWGNSPVSTEMQRPLNNDDPTLLNFGSGVSFDNRMIQTASPVSTTNGVVHQSLVVLQLDLISTIQKKSSPSWEGMWTGLNIFQLVEGSFAGTNRLFAFGYNFQFPNLEIYELLPEQTTQTADNGSNPIIWAVETPVFFGNSVKPDTDLCELRDGEIYLSAIQGAVHVDVYYRPDYYECWTKWAGIDVCQATPQPNSKPGYRTRLGLGEPDVTPTETNNNRPLRQGNFFQFRIVITGSCIFNRMKVSSKYVPEQTYASIDIPEKVCQVINCDLPNDITLYQLEGSPTPAQPTFVPSVPTPFLNQQVFFSHTCPAGSLLLTTANFPTWITLDSVNQQLIGSAGQFPGATQAAANAVAQTALNSFAATLLANGQLFCTSTAPASCAGTDTSAYMIQGYFDGLIKNPLGQNNGGPNWDGSFQFQQIGSLCQRAGSSQLFSSINFHTTTCILLSFTAGVWQFDIWAWLGGGSALNYRATKTTGNSPAGVYTRISGNQTTPTTVTIVPMPGTTCSQININGC